MTTVQMKIPTDNEYFVTPSNLPDIQLRAEGRLNFDINRDDSDQLG